MGDKLLRTTRSYQALALVLVLATQVMAGDKVLDRLESKLYGTSRSDSPEAIRLSSLEKDIFGAAKPQDTSDKRLKALSEVLGLDASPGEVRELPELASKMQDILDEERSFRGLGPLKSEETASGVATRHAKFLARTGKFSAYGAKGLNPDLRYTRAGGEGRVHEIVEGYFSSEPIEATTETAHQLMDAMLATPDQSDILFDPANNALGVSFVLSPDRKQLVAVLELVCDRANLSKLPDHLDSGSVLSMSGYLPEDYDFAWVGVAKQRLARAKTATGDYFPPLDQVLYVDAGSSRVRGLAKLGGMVVGMAAAPFTYGLSAIAAQAVVAAMDSGQYRQRDVRALPGVDTDLGGRFELRTRKLVANEPTVFYFTVWAVRDGQKKPTAISRRAIVVG